MDGSTRELVDRCGFCAHGVTMRERPFRAPPPSNGSPSARPNCCPCHTSTWCLRCQGRSPIIAYQNKAAIYDLLFKAAAEATLTIAADRKHTHQVRSS